MYDQVELVDQKEQKVDRGGLKTSANEDIISHLPDSLLHYILSFLSTECAFSTSILAKRWRDLWMSTTNLEFTFYRGYDNHRNCKLIRKFISFVDQVLLYHSSNIKRFHVWCEYDIRSTRANPWISAAVNRQVEELDLLLRASVIRLPLCLCTSKVLKVLTLRLFSIVELPSTICLPSLKILRLVDIELMDDLSFGGLFSGLPNIEELEIINLCWDTRLKSVAISLPTLRRLRITSVCVYRRSEPDIVVKLTAKNLMNLHFEASLLSIDLIVDTMPSLVDANIQFPTRYICARSAWHTYNLFSALGFARSITIGKDGFKDIPCLENINLFPVFVNMTSLKAELTVKSSAAVLLVNILKNSPVLESLVIKKICVCEWFKEPYPRCIEFSLRDCSLKNFMGCQEEIVFVESLLKAAKVLKRLNIHCSSYLCSRPKELEDIIYLLEMLPRVSDSCVIDFIK